MEENKWSAKKYTIIENIARDIIISNIEVVKDISISPSGAYGKSIHLIFKITFNDDGTEKVTYKIPEDIQSELEKSPKNMIEFAVGYITNHLMKQIFRIKMQEK